MNAHREQLMSLYIQRLSLDFVSERPQVPVPIPALPRYRVLHLWIQTLGPVRVPARVARRVNEAVVASQVSYRWLRTLNQYRVNHGNTPSILAGFFFFFSLDEEENTLTT